MVAIMRPDKSPAAENPIEAAVSDTLNTVEKNNPVKAPDSNVSMGKR